MPDSMLPDDEIEPGAGAIAHRWFPAGPAEDKSYIARHEEYRRLFDDTLAGRNRWFDCPARYGVGTIVNRVRRSLRHNYRPRMTSARCDLRGIHDREAFATVMLEGLGQLAAQVIRRYSVVEEHVAPLFPETPKEIYLDELHLQTIRFLPTGSAFEALPRIAAQLQELTRQEKCRNMLVVWDSEQILGLRAHRDIGAMLARLLQASELTSWVFQGNNQHSMRTIFGSEDSALRGHCLRFALRRIDVPRYQRQISEAAKARWDCYVGAKATRMILALTRRHPYWFNTLCRRLWYEDLPPLIPNVVTEWKRLTEYHRHRFAREFERLSPNQRSVLLAIAETPTNQPRAKAFVRRTRVSSASVGQAIRILAEQDLIETDADGVWQVKDPLMQWALFPNRELVSAIYEGRPWPV